MGQNRRGADRPPRRPSADATHAAKSQYGAALLGVVGTIVAALIAAGVTVYVSNREDDPVRAARTQLPQPGPTTGWRSGPAQQSDSPPPVETVVTNTWEESEQKLVGVAFYPSPHHNGDRVRGVDEGTRVWVVCQERHGRLATDTKYHNRQTSSTVWDKLTNGYYISDIYTTLPKVSGDDPPLGIPRCG